MGLETKIQKDIINLLVRDSRVGWCHRCNTGKALINGRPVEIGLGRGTADIIGQMSDGAFMAVEVKTPTGRVSEAQQLWLKRVAMHGGFACVVRSVGEARKYVDMFTEGDRGLVFGLGIE